MRSTQIFSPSRKNPVCNPARCHEASRWSGIIILQIHKHVYMHYCNFMNTKRISFIHYKSRSKHIFPNITALPELCRVGVDLSSHTEQFLDDIILQDGVLTCPSPSPSSVPLLPPHNQRLIELLMSLCPANWVQVLPKGAIEG